jgi:hypothetical protein
MVMKSTSVIQTGFRHQCQTGIQALHIGCATLPGLLNMQTLRKSEDVPAVAASNKISTVFVASSKLSSGNSMDIIEKRQERALPALLNRVCILQQVFLNKALTCSS